MDKLTSILALADDGMVAVNKAAELASQFDACLDIVATDSTRMCDLAIHCAMRGHDKLKLSYVQRGAEPAETLLVRHAMERRPDLVIKTAASAHPLRRWTLEPTDRWLASECPVPVLLVGDRPWNGSLHMAAAVDVADFDSERFARAILQSAGFLALGCRARLDVLYSEREANDERLRMERIVKLAQLVREFHIAGERLQRFDGAPEHTLPRIIEARQYDVMVIGAITHRPGIGAWFETLSSKLATATSGDLLLVKPDERAAWRGVAMASGREQRPHLPEQFL
jgi:nucleotide-binding universal stress UspA family protein